MKASQRTFAAIAAVAAVALLATGCSGAGAGVGSGGGSDTVNVLMVNNPQMVDLQKLTAANFTKKTGITVKFTSLPENDARAKIATEFAAQSGQYDVASISPYEEPTYAKNGWLAPLDSIAKDKAFDQKDIFPAFTKALSSDGHLYAEPFYGESSFLMYRKDVFAKAGLTVPAKPTWQQVADLAAKVDHAEPGMRGICLRGQTGWGQVFAPLTTVVNTFGGTWFDKDWNAQVNTGGFKEATKFYVDLLRKHGETGASQAGFTECLNDLQQGKVAMWYDATSAAGALEASDSPVAGKIGYVAAPVVETKSSGWLWTWSWGIQKASKHQEAAKKFITWASSKEYEQLVGREIGWANVPSGKRASTNEIPAYQKAAAPFYKQAQEAIATADPENPGVQPRPAPGIQFVAIPEFADMATSASQGISNAIAGKESVDNALNTAQSLAEAVGKKYQK